MRFGGILRSGDIGKFDEWLRDTRAAGIYGMRRFVRTLQQDLAAVRNAITERSSNGQTEGQISRLETLQRDVWSCWCRIASRSHVAIPLIRECAM